MIITVGTITIPITPVMAMVAGLAGVLAWDLEWDGAWACPSDTDTHIRIGAVTVHIMVMVDTDTTIPGMAPGADMADTMATLIMEVPTGADITTDTTMAIITEDTGMVIPKPITATEEWITGTMPVIPGPQKPL